MELTFNYMIRHISILLICFIGCTKNESVTSPITPKDSTSINFNVDGKIIPFKLGNSWTYIDSITSMNVLTVNRYSYSVDSMYLYNSDTIWVVKYHDQYDSFYPFTEYRINNDSVYFVDYGEGGRYESLEYIKPQTFDSTFYRVSIGGDAFHNQCAVKLSEGYKTIHGVIAGCISIGYSNSKFTILKPGIGIIYSESRNEKSQYFYKHNLIKVTLK
jgi:hypothetical protein